MNTKWNEMTKQEKIHNCLMIIFAVVALAFIMLDIFTEWEYANLGWCITFGLYIVMESKINWKKNIKLAIIQLVLGILLVAVNLFTQFV